MKTIVTVVNTISATSMPINGFVIYRSRNHYPCKQILIVCDHDVPDNVVLPEDVELHLVGSSLKELRMVVKGIKSRYPKAVYCMHAPKSALQLFYSTIGLGVWKRTLFSVRSTYKDRDTSYKFQSALATLMAARINCCSDAAYNGYSGFVKAVKGKRFSVITNGVDFNRLIQQCDSSRRTFSKTLLCIGRMIPLKNHKFLVTLMSYLPDYRLILIGSEDASGEIRRMAQETGVIDRIEFTGLIGRDDVFKRLNDAAIYVSPSKIEGMPVGVLEAMAAGLIPVLSDIEPHKEIASYCRHTYAIPCDIDRWVETIKKLENYPVEQYQTLCNEMVDDVRNNYSLETMHKKYNEIYDQLSK